eukprot:gnl/TRDRNA2_/TRDRNA2_188384_c0_seq1.p1 gnl/TRDRNA2_/TRDRNA2_188384_c0~~gnl/TRDRNA2_/TRDRNA2_188384_c0_seq1.p1  ORF type:complete len:393 (-),score=70.88 gnl/TRDRNA2_/TRDRNA2_188384_c0_seq1:142-1257(-)
MAAARARVDMVASMRLLLRRAAGRRGRIPTSALTNSTVAAAAAAALTAAAASKPRSEHQRPQHNSDIVRFSLALRCDEVLPPGRPRLVDSMPPKIRLEKSTIRLYQFESCPFCRKVRSCLDYHQLPYELVEVDPLSKAEMAQIAPDYKKVPVLQITSEDGEQIQLRDSKTIVRSLLTWSRAEGISAHASTPKVPAPQATPSTQRMWPPVDGVHGSTQEQWVRWTDAVLVQCIVLNVYRTLQESAETFGYLLTHPAFSWFAKLSGALSGTVVMWGVANFRKSKYDVPDVRQALYEAVSIVAEAVKCGGGRFLGGAHPGEADFNVYGILRSAEACATERDMLEHCPCILPWYDAMRAEVGPSCALNAQSIKRG